MARTQVFRGYRSVTTGVSGGIAVLAAGLQGLVVPEPGKELKVYVLHWVGAAALSLIVVAIEMVLRSRRSGVRTQGQLMLLAVEQFMPSVVAGALVTFVIAEYAREAAWMLPGLWIVLFSLGVFASSRLLPRATFYVAGMYLLAGLVVLVLSKRGWAFSPGLMGVPFGAGQTIMAGILYWNLERRKEGKHE
jgi:hypothetical protein